MVAHLTVARVAEGLGVSWNTANDAVLTEGKRVLINDPKRLDGVRVLGVDEHVWRHTRRGDKYVTVIIDLTGVRDGTGPARLLTWSKAAPNMPSTMALGSDRVLAPMSVLGEDGIWLPRLTWELTGSLSVVESRPPRRNICQRRLLRAGRKSRQVFPVRDHHTTVLAAQGRRQDRRQSCYSPQPEDPVCGRLRR